MDSSLRDPFYSMGEKIIGYLPNLFAGIVLVAIGWVLGWVVKRVVFQLCVILRLERLLRSFRWGEEFSKADIRHALFNTIGDVSFFIVFLIFLNAALDALQLTVLSSLLQRGVLFIPKFLISAVIVLVGWIIARWVSVTVKKALTKEDVPRATLISRFLKAVMLLFFSAMALTELDTAREIVIIGFTVTIITLGALVVILTSMGRKSIVKKMLATLEEK